jgi:hypothetical protein
MGVALANRRSGKSLQVIALSPLDVAASVAWHGNRERTGR